MPPIGSTINDEQIAAVLTYVRREWGQSGTPVSAAAIAEVRRATADRNRPWKHDELMAMPVYLPAEVRLAWRDEADGTGRFVVESTDGTRHMEGHYSL